MRDQNNDNQDKKSYNLKKNMERNKNLIYDYDMDADTETENKDTQKYTKNHNQENVEKEN
jgi:hypothetical protein